MRFLLSDCRCIFGATRADRWPEAKKLLFFHRCRRRRRCRTSQKLRGRQIVSIRSERKREKKREKRAREKEHDIIEATSTAHRRVSSLFLSLLVQKTHTHTESWASVAHWARRGTGKCVCTGKRQVVKQGTGKRTGKGSRVKSESTCCYTTALASFNCVVGASSDSLLLLLLLDNEQSNSG